jgi:vacuolar-type H+-ATPase subunit E/Vma4
MRISPGNQVSQASAALEPVRAELLRSACADAEALRARADRDAEELLRRARAGAEAILAEARRQGEADGEHSARAVLARARREARRHELAARREMYEELHSRTAERIRALRDAPDYPALLDGLGARVRRLLGPGAHVTEHASGGVVGQAGSRRADCSLDALAERALARAGTEVEALWAP